ncbi:MAG: nitronate monooxygenase [Caulobacteraceae bacterium]|nr:nitronate monooxygenase [Caulobacteraceae bacterium]
MDDVGLARRPEARSFAGNRVARDTGAKYPIIQAPMSWIARAQLASAVSAAGGLGLIENSSRNLEIVQRETAMARAATDKPFGYNLPVKFMKVAEEEEKSILDWVIGQKPRFVTTSAGDPRRYVGPLRDAGIIVYHATPSLEGSLKAEDAGVDGLVVEGAESAGIRAADGPHSFVLLQAVRERVSCPIVAAGGIVDGRGMAAAFALGAEGIAMGTRFVASAESPVHPAYKAAIVAAGIRDTLNIPGAPGSVQRVLRSPLSERVRSGEGDPRAARRVIQGLYIEGDLENSMGTAGESAGLIHGIKTVGEIIADTVAGFWREIDRLAALRG